MSSSRIAVVTGGAGAIGDAADLRRAAGEIGQAELRYVEPESRRRVVH